MVIAESVGVAYERYWGLEAPPFENVPDPRFYVPSVKHEAARQRILHGVQARKGAVMLTGEIGSGKTLLSRSLILDLPKAKYDVALLANPSLPEPQFLGEILYQFGLPVDGSKAVQMRRLNEHLLSNARQGVDAVLVIDEAQTILEDRIFDEVRLLMNYQMSDRFLLTLVLLGQPELRERIARIPQLMQRIAVRYHLDRFDVEETQAYIQGRLAAAGCSRKLFTVLAAEAIHRHTGGVCRVINALCDFCLFIGAQERVERIDRTLVLRLADLS
ncbi:MAG: AAA family ATPase [Nitrospira sp.]|nr:AAA family ATPase [Nitrospira sp.]